MCMSVSVCMGSLQTCRMTPSSTVDFKSTTGQVILYPEALYSLIKIPCSIFRNGLLALASMDRGNTATQYSKACRGVKIFSDSELTDKLLRTGRTREPTI